MKNIFDFYKKPFVCIVLILLAYSLIFGTYYEEYEGIFAAFIQGIYTYPVDKIFQANNNFIIIKLYTIFQKYIGEYSAYGIVLVFYNYLCYIFIGLVLFRILKINLPNKFSYKWYILLYLLILLPNAIHLNTARQVILLISAFFAYYLSNMLEGNKTKMKYYFPFLLFIYILCFIRSEAVLLGSCIFILCMIIFGKSIKVGVYTLIISTSIILLYNYTSKYYTIESEQVFIFKEKDIIDRNNIDFDNISKFDSLHIIALRDYMITDSFHYQLSFYDKILPKNPYKLLSVLNFNLDKIALKNTFYNTIPEISKASLLIYLYIIVSIIASIFVKKNKWKIIILNVFIMIIPFALCAIVIVPNRFLTPYFCMFSIVNILFIIQNNSEKYLSRIVICFLIIFIYKDIQEKKEYISLDENFEAVTTKFISLQNLQKEDNPIVLNTIMYNNYFPVKPLKKVKPRNVVILNLSLFNGIDFFRNKWDDMCGCNSLSLKNRVEYICNNNIPFVSDVESLKFLNEYMFAMYGYTIFYDKKMKFGKNINVYTLSY